MNYPDEDDVEEGELLFDNEEDSEDIYQRIQDLKDADERWLVTPRKSDGFAPADFMYDPIGSKGRDFE